MSDDFLTGKSRRTAPFKDDEMPFYDVSLEEIPLLIRGVDVWYSNPLYLNSSGTFVEEKMTLTDEEIQTGIACLQQIILDTVDQYFYADYQRLIRRRRARNSGQTPTPHLLSGITYQPLLGL